jgi:hypothetical protein
MKQRQLIAGAALTVIAALFSGYDRTGFGRQIQRKCNRILDIVHCIVWQFAKSNPQR